MNLKEITLNKIAREDCGPVTYEFVSRSSYTYPVLFVIVTHAEERSKNAVKDEQKYVRTRRITHAVHLELIPYNDCKYTDI